MAPIPGVFDNVGDFTEWFSAPFHGPGERLPLAEEEQLLIIRRLHQVPPCPWLARRGCGLGGSAQCPCSLAGVCLFSQPCDSLSVC